LLWKTATGIFAGVWVRDGVPQQAFHEVFRAFVKLFLETVLVNDDGALEAGEEAERHDKHNLYTQLSVRRGHHGQLSSTSSVVQLTILRFSWIIFQTRVHTDSLLCCVRSTIETRTMVCIMNARHTITRQRMGAGERDTDAARSKPQMRVRPWVGRNSTSHLLKKIVQ
jgi:hypothetical protein